jgi:2-haloacid dehalogenase
MQTNTNVKAMVFDVFGTVVDWRSSLIEEGRQWNQRKGWTVDWAAFADRWRAGYAPAMQRVRSGQLPWTRLDDLHRMVLDEILRDLQLELRAAEREQLNRVWHRLQPWPDSVAGLQRLKRKYIIATLSNGNVSLLTNMAKHAGLPWDTVLSAELARHYKPDPEVYLMAADLLGCRPQETMMVTAHRNDLDAAAKLGLRTAFVHRPREFGAGPRKADTAQPGEFDLVARDFLDLAAQTGA